MDKITKERLNLFQTLKKLPSSTFAEILFAVNPPAGSVSGSSAPQADRVRELLEWVESPVGPGLPALRAVIEHYVKAPSLLYESDDKVSLPHLPSPFNFLRLSRAIPLSILVGVSAFLIFSVTNRTFASRDKYTPILPDPSREENEYQQVSPLLSQPPNLLSIFDNQEENANPIRSDGSVSAIALVRAIQSRYTASELVYGDQDKTPQGSNVGINQVSSGELDMAISSRPLKESEEAGGLRAVAIAKDAIAVIVHKDNPINNLSKGQLEQIYTCKINDWVTLGWPKENDGVETLPIEVINRSSESGTREVFRDRVLGEQDFCSSGSGSSDVRFRTWERDETTPVIQSLSKYGIYYASLNHVIGNQSIKVLSIDNVHPANENGANILIGNYSLSRDMYVVSRKETYTNVINLIGFLISAEGQQIIRRYHVPLYQYDTK